MKNLLNSTLTRRIHLIEKLTYADSPKHTDEIFEEFCCSDRTIYRDIRDINDYWNYLNIYRVNNYLKIHYKKGYYIDNIYKDIINTELPFQIINTLIYEDGLSMDELVEKLHSSPSTLYRMIDMMNSYFKSKYEFKIETTPCTFSGKEGDIRAFIFHFFNEKCSITDWPFEDIDEKLIDDFLLFFMKQFDIDGDYSFYRSLKMYFAINLIFLKKSRRIDESEIKVFNKKRFQIFSDSVMKFKDIKKLEDNLGINLSQANLKQLFFPLLTCGNILNNDDFKDYMKIDNSIHDRITAIYDFIDEINKIIPVLSSEKEEFARTIYNVLNLRFYSPDSDYILMNKNTIFYNLIYKADTDVASKINTCVYNLYSKLDYKINQDFHMFFMDMFFTSLNNYLTKILQKRESKKALLISSVGYNHAHMYRQRLSYDLSSLVILDLYDRQRLDLEWINNSDYDLIISSSPISGLSDDKEVFIIGFAPNKDDHQDLVDLLNDNFTIE